jgi:hypothetical protein
MRLKDKLAVITAAASGMGRSALPTQKLCRRGNTPA